MAAGLPAPAGGGGVGFPGGGFGGGGGGGSGFGGSMGGANFVFVADTQQFLTQINQMQSITVSTTNNIVNNFNKVGNASKNASNQAGSASKGMANGLLMLAQAADDAQYGFRAVVNNIPGVVAAIGGSAGVAGAVGLLAVGINQVVNHWDELEDKLKGTNLGDTITGDFILLKDAIFDANSALRIFVSTFGEITGLTKALNLGDWLEGGGSKDLNAIERKRAAEKKAFDEGKNVARIAGEEDAKAGSAFKEAIAKFGGDVKLREETFKR